MRRKLAQLGHADIQFRDVIPFLLPITYVRSVSGDYLRQHKIANRPVLIGLDPRVAGRMRLVATPQTIVVNNGKVERSWVGRLSDSDIHEITGALRQ